MSPYRGHRVVGAGALALLLALAPQAACAVDTVAFTITDSRIEESSGLATDTEQQLYWTSNDSGDRGRLFALDPTGKVVGTANYAADVEDVEALAMRGTRLYVGDIGDNDAERDSITVYYFDNLTPGDGVAAYRSYDFEFPDGPRNAETLLVDAGGRLYIVTKEEKGGGVYAAPADPSRSVINTLERVGDAPVLVTDGTYLPDGKIVLRTEETIEVVDPGNDYGVVAQAPAPDQPQGESVTVDLAGTGLLVGSEGENSEVWAVSIPTAAQAAPTPSATPTGSAGTGVDDALDVGTLQAVGLAAVVAVVAGAVVGLARSRRRP